MAVNHFPTLGGEKVESILVFLGGHLRIDLAPHPGDRFFRDRGGNEKRFARHPEIALRIVRRDAALVAESEMNAIPREIARDPGKLAVNRPRRIPAGKGDPELIALAESSVGVAENELRCLRHEISGANDVALHLQR